MKVSIALGVLLAVTTFAVYSHALRNPFVNFDDPGYVSENRQVQQGLTRDTFRWAFTTTQEANWHPLTWLSHAMDCQLYGLHPAGHHLTSVALHILSALLLFLLLWRATGATGRSLLVAALFALHPINVESVAWVAERKNVLSMLFFFLTLAAYGWYVRRQSVARYLALPVLFALGLAAKPMIVTLPFALLLLDFWPLQRIKGWEPASPDFPLEQRPFWRLALEKVPLLLLAAASSIVTMAVQHGAIEAAVPFTVRFSNVVYSYAMYVEKVIWPLHLAAFYPYAGFRLSGWLVLFCLFLLIGITTWVWRERSSRRYLLVGWLWFLGTLVPMIGLVQVGDQGMADRYAYLPAIGIFVMLVWWGDDLAQRRKIPLARRAGAAGLAIAVLSFLTWRQIETWSSNYALWAHAAQATRDNFMAENYLGEALTVANFKATGQRYSEEAAAHFRNAVRLNPTDPTSRINLGADLYEHGEIKEAVEQYVAALQLTQNPEFVTKALIGLGAAYQQLGIYDKARECYMQALRMQPSNAVIFMNLGKLAMEERMGKLAAAAAAHPTADAYWQLGQVQRSSGHIAEARASYQMALKLNPKLSEVQAALASLNATGH